MNASTTLHGWLRLLFFLVVVRPLVLVIIGLNVRHRERLPRRGPAILVANHNSHLDALALMALLPLRLLPRVRPVAAADYFLRNRAFAWFSTHILGVLPVDRHKNTGNTRDTLSGVSDALRHGDVVIFFPEGSRGEPEHRERFRSGIAHVAREAPGVPVIPVLLHGFGKSLPRGEALLVPFSCDVFVGEAMGQCEGSRAFVREIESQLAMLAVEGDFPDWN
jgi:1-acyl-sn-glycerol-3-phosphate acyltransferase